MQGAVFVTGGSGFIGGRLLARLTDEGHTVRALARSDAAAARVAQLGAEPVFGDLADRDAIRTGARGCATAFHLAAHLGEWGDRAEYRRVNVDGTRNTLESCFEAGVERFVHCGTEAALMAGRPLVGVDEMAPLRPDSPAPYPATKAQAEQLVRLGRREGFETVVVRPRFVWGAGDTTLLPELLESVRKGRFAWVGGGRQLTETTHVDNVVEGLILGAEHGRGGAAYFVTDGEPAVFREFVSELLRSQGVEPPQREVSARLALPLGRACELAWGVLPLPGEPPMTRFRAWLLTQECTIRIDKARGELGYAPVTSRDEGMIELRAAA